MGGSAILATITRRPSNQPEGSWPGGRGRVRRCQLPSVGTGVQVIVIVQFVDPVSVTAYGPISSKPSCCDAPRPAQHFPCASNARSHCGVPVSPVLLLPSGPK